MGPLGPELGQITQITGILLYGYYSCRNYQRPDDGHVYSTKRMLSLQSDFVCPQHFEWNGRTVNNFESYLESSQETDDAFCRIIDQPDPQIGIDINEVSFYSYQVAADPGSTIQYQLRIRNWIYQESHLHGVIRIPDRRSVSPVAVDLVVPAKFQSSIKFQVEIPPEETRLNRGFALIVDLRRDDHHLGELTEGLVNMSPMRSH